MHNVIYLVHAYSDLFASLFRICAVIYCLMHNAIYLVFTRLRMYKINTYLVNTVNRRAVNDMRSLLERTGRRPSALVSSIQ